MASPKAAASAVITGASTGIGRATALYLDQQGIRVFAGVRKPEDGERLKADAGELLTPVILDVTDETSIESAAKTVEDAVGDAGLGGVVNNAGIAVGGVQDFMNIGELRWQLEVNVIGPVAVTKAFLPLIRRGSGRIVNVSSNGGFVAAPFLGPYAASKFALEALSDSLRRELRRWKIHVAVIEPGSIQSDIWDKGREQAQEVQASLEGRAEELYGEAFEKMNQYVETTSARAIPAEEVAKRVHHALTASRPRTRYRVGMDAELTHKLAWLLPDRVLDSVLARLSGIS